MVGCVQNCLRKKRARKRRKKRREKKLKQSNAKLKKTANASVRSVKKSVKKPKSSLVNNVFERKKQKNANGARNSRLRNLPSLVLVPPWDSAATVRLPRMRGEGVRDREVSLRHRSLLPRLDLHPVAQTEIRHPRLLPVPHRDLELRAVLHPLLLQAEDGALVPPLKKLEVSLHPQRRVRRVRLRESRRRVRRRELPLLL